MRCIFSIAVVVCLCVSALAQPLPRQTPGVPEGEGVAPPIVNALDRVAFSLNGMWRVIVDPYDAGSVAYLGAPMRPGWAEHVERTRPEQLIEHDYDTAQTLEVPGDWSSQRDDLYHYEGTVFYRKTFSFEPTPGMRQFLHFGAVNRHASVWLNDEYLGSHHVGFTPFSFDVTGKFREGENSVAVRVDNRRRAEDVPALMTDWWNYGGITREVSLLEVPETFVRSWDARLIEGDSIQVDVTVDGPGASGAELRVRIPELGLSWGAAADESGRATVRMPFPGTGVKWSPESPRLYDLVVQLGEQSVTDRVGFRRIETRGRDILLNGEPVFLRGISIHEEGPIGGRRAWSESDARTLLGWAKDLGCNFVRLAHYTHNEHMVRVADELGLMVWGEIPVYWVLEFQNEVTRAYARTHLTEMIERDRNRASVVIWSVGNENRADAAQTAFRVDLARLARELDTSRLISAACFARMRRENGKLARMVIDDPFGEAADVLAINEYVGWYGGHTRDLAGVTVETKWEKPFMLSEFGAGVKQGLHGDPEEVWTEEFGERFYRDQLDWCDELREAGMLQGISPWILRDFRSPRRLLGGVQDGFNRKGLISERGVKKGIFEVVRERYERWAGEDAPD